MVVVVLLVQVLPCRFRAVARCGCVRASVASPTAVWCSSNSNRLVQVVLQIATPSTAKCAWRLAVVTRQ